MAKRVGKSAKKVGPGRRQKITAVDKEKLAAGVAQGKTNRQLCEEFGLSKNTVAAYVADPEVVARIEDHLLANSDTVSAGMKAYFDRILGEIKQTKDIERSYAAADRLMKAIENATRPNMAAATPGNPEGRPAVGVGQMVATLENYTKQAVLIRGSESNYD